MGKGAFCVCVCVLGVGTAIDFRERSAPQRSDVGLPRQLGLEACSEDYPSDSRVRGVRGAGGATDTRHKIASPPENGKALAEQIDFGPNPRRAGPTEDVRAPVRHVYVLSVSISYKWATLGLPGRGASEAFKKGRT